MCVRVETLPKRQRVPENASTARPILSYVTSIERTWRRIAQRSTGVLVSYNVPPNTRLLGESTSFRNVVETRPVVIRSFGMRPTSTLSARSSKLVPPFSPSLPSPSFVPVVKTVFENFQAKRVRRRNDEIRVVCVRFETRVFRKYARVT